MSDKRTKTGTKKKSSPKRVKEVAYKKTETVVCTKCGKNPIDSKVLPPGQQWICHECDTTLETYREFLSWIRLRIKALSSEGEFIGKMVVRELVQNADDAKDLDGFGAKRIVFRFQDDALYVANDGRAFTLEDEGDFDRIRRVLGEHKRKEEGVTGQHGSGFWTVYAITNTPEVHSTGWSKRFNPGKKEWEHYNPGSDGYRTSPYIEEDAKGVLFRFSWRTEEKAKQSYGSTKPFLDRGWSRWSYDERRKFFEELREYLPSALLCCRHIESIACIWDDGSEELEASYAHRDFALGGSITTSLVNVWHHEAKTARDFKHSFQINDWNITKTRKYEYFLGSAKVVKIRAEDLHFYSSKETDPFENDTCYIISKTDDESSANTIRELKDGVPSGYMKVKEPVVHVLLPIAENMELESLQPPIYSFIPLPVPSKNKFILNADLFVTENRDGFSVDEEERHSAWYLNCVYSLCNLYFKTFSEMLNWLKETDKDTALKQKIIFDNLPVCGVENWLRPDKEMIKAHHRVYKHQNEQVLQYLSRESIVATSTSWEKLNEMHIVETNDENGPLLVDILNSLGENVLNPGYLSYDGLKRILEARKKQKDFGPDELKKVWNDFANGLKSKSGKLAIRSEKKSRNPLTLDLVGKMVKFCFRSKTDNLQLRELQIVPDLGGSLHTISELKAIPAEYEMVKEILPKNLSMDEEIMGEIEFRNEEIYTPEEILKLVSKVYLKNKAKFEDTNGLYFRIAGIVLTEACEEQETIRLNKLKSIPFITCRVGDKGVLSPPNFYGDDDEGSCEWTGKSGSHLLDSYRPEHIFSPDSDDSEIEGLPQAILDGITFLYLPEVSQQTIVDKRLGLARLKAAGSIRGWVQVYLADSESLFKKEHLKTHLGIKSITKDLLNQYRKEFLKSLRVYFKGGTSTFGSKNVMKDIRCLYNESEDWKKPSEFAYNIDRDLRFFEYDNLHQDFKGLDWDWKALEVMGVVEKPELQMIEKTWADLVKRKTKERSKLVRVALYLIEQGLSSKESPKLCDEMHDSLWIPTNGGVNSFGLPSDCLLPSESNYEIMGRKFPNFIDIPTEDDFEKADGLQRDFVAKKDVEEQEETLRIWFKPNLDHLLSAIDMVYPDAPPTKLFDYVSGFLQENHQLSSSKYNLNYYQDNQWYKPQEIVIQKQDDLPTGLSNIPLLKQPKHTPFLRAIGAKTEINISQALLWISKNPKDSTIEVWEWMAKRFHHGNVQIDSEILYDAIDQISIPISEIGNVLLSRLWITESSHYLSRPCKLGSSYIISEDMLPSNHVDFYRKLECTFIETTNSDDLEDIISQLSRKSAKDETAYNLFFYILDIYSRLVPSGKVPGGKIPVKFNGTTKIIPTEEVWIPDNTTALRFKDDIHIIQPAMLVNHRSLEKFLCNHKNKAHLFSRHLRYKKLEFEEEDDDRNEILQDLHEAIMRFAGDKKKILGLDWWLETRIYYADQTQVTYELQRGDKPPITKDAIDEPYVSEDDFLVVLPRTATKRLASQLADLLLQKVQADTNLLALVEQLLVWPPTEWERYVPDYSYSGVASMPVVLVISSPEYLESYRRTREEMKDMYGECQVCGSRTPSEFKSREPVEKLKRIFTSRGGMSVEHSEVEYRLGNCLYLCSRCEELYERGCLRLDFFWDFVKCLPEYGGNRKIMELVQNKLKQAFSKFEESEDGINWLQYEIWDFECQDGIFTKSPKSESNDMRFTSQHYKSMLNWMVEYLDKRIIS